MTKEYEQNIESNLVKLIDDEDRNIYGGSDATVVIGTIGISLEVADAFSITSACTEHCMNVQ